MTIEIFLYIFFTNSNMAEDIPKGEFLHYYIHLSFRGFDRCQIQHNLYTQEGILKQHFGHVIIEWVCMGLPWIGEL